MRIVMMRQHATVGTMGVVESARRPVLRGAAAAVAAIVAVLCLGSPVSAQSSVRVGLVFEGAAAWQNRNDVRIPPATGTPFSIVDLIGAAPGPAARGELTVDIDERHGIRLVYAPLTLTGSGTPSTPIAFAGGQFAPIPTDAEYQFSNYRATYRYRVFAGDTWQWHVGFTGFIRDARIALAQPGVAAKDTDVGFVPLAHLKGDARFNEHWRFTTELDATAAPQGRAFDVSAFITYRPARRWSIGGGYRTIEGGADVDEVYTFAWLNAAIVRVGFEF